MIQYFASDYAYGINPTVDAAIVQSGSNAAGATGTMIVNKPSVTLAFGRVINPAFNTNAVINIDGDTAVTVSAVSTAYPNGETSLTLTTPTHAHGKGSIISSGTVGLQEALNDASLRTNGGMVIVDAYWTLLGGTNAMVTGATLPTGVTISDIRNATGSSPARPTAITADGAVPITPSQVYSVTKAGVCAMTLATQATDGVVITIISATKYAHTLTATGLLLTGTASVNVGTFAAYVGAQLTLTSTGGKWLVSNSQGVVYT